MEGILLVFGMGLFVIGVKCGGDLSTSCRIDSSCSISAFLIISSINLLKCLSCVRSGGSSSELFELDCSSAKLKKKTFKI